MTVPYPGGCRDTIGIPDLEQPVDGPETPAHDWAGPAPTPEHHPADVSSPGSHVPRRG